MVAGTSNFFQGIFRPVCNLRIRQDFEQESSKSGIEDELPVKLNQRYALDPTNGLWPCGWVLIETNYASHEADHTTRLYFDVGAGYADECALDIPVTRKGSTPELFLLPNGIVGMQWAPTRLYPAILRSPFCMRRVGVIERSFRMLRRIVPVLWRQPLLKLKMIGLGYSSPLHDLAGAYAAAGKLRSYASAPTYPQWIQYADTLSKADRILIDRHVKRFTVSPRFVLLVAVPADGHARVEHTLHSIQNQLYRSFEVCVLNQGQLGTWIPLQESNTYVTILQAGDVLPEHALYWIANVINSSPAAGLIYSDEDSIETGGERRDPVFKPDWSAELLRSTNYIGQLAVFRADELIRAGGLGEADVFGNGHDLVLRVSEGLSAERICHIPAILIHRRVRNEAAGGAAVVAAHLSRLGIEASVNETFPGVYRVRYALPQKLPKISILVPTRDGLDLLKRCVDSILQKSNYQDYEILIIDNQSKDPEALGYLASVGEDMRVRVLHFDAPFNFSAINNFAARQAQGEVLCLLNNDTEVISADWLEEMLGRLLQAKVGVVGAKLYFPDGRIQHGGDLIGVGGLANHAHAYQQRTNPGYCNRAVVAQDLSAVTAACMLTWRSLYQELGGLDEQHLQVAFNDVDYCLRVREAGYRVVWTPYAELYHHESVSRGKDLTPEKKRRARREVTYMRKRWERVLQNDPYYNPNLSHERPDFSLSHAPMVEKPWRE